MKAITPRDMLKSWIAAAERRLRRMDAAQELQRHALAVYVDELDGGLSVGWIERCSVPWTAALKAIRGIVK